MISRCRMKDHFCNECKKLLRRDKCCYSRWREKPDNIHVLQHSKFCTPCWKELGCHKCGLKFDEVFSKKTPVYEFSSWFEYFKYDRDREYETNKKFEDHKEKLGMKHFLTCFKCYSKDIEAGFNKRIPPMRGTYEIFDETSFEKPGRKIKQYDVEKNLDVVLFIIPTDCFGIIFSFLEFPKMVQCISLSCKILYNYLHFLPTTWITNIRIVVRRQKSGARNHSYSILDREKNRIFFRMLFIMENQYPKFTLEGLETFDFGRHLTMECYMLLLRYAGKNLRQVFHHRYLKACWTLEYIVSKSLSKIEDLHVITKAILTYQFMDKMYEMKNLKQLYLVDNKQKRLNMIHRAGKRFFGSSSDKFYGKMGNFDTTEKDLLIIKGEGLRNLEELTVFNSNFKIMGIIEKLKYLKIIKCGIWGIPEIDQNQIQSIKIEEHVGITYKTKEQEVLDLLNKGKKLRVLRVHTKDCFNLIGKMVHLQKLEVRSPESFLTFINLITKCVNLEWIRVNFMDFKDKSDVITQNTKLPKNLSLKTFIFNGYKNLDLGILYLFPNIVKLHLHYSGKELLNPFKYIVQMKKLEYLTLDVSDHQEVNATKPLQKYAGKLKEICYRWFRDNEINHFLDLVRIRSLEKLWCRFDLKNDAVKKIKKTKIGENLKFLGVSSLTEEIAEIIFTISHIEVIKTRKGMHFRSEFVKKVIN